MDFVDLDRVLDEFEEEEKAAEVIVPGQEVRPSGYAEYIEQHLEKPWEALSKDHVTTAVINSIADQNNVTLNYDDPYQGERLSKLDYITNNDVVNNKLGLDTTDYGCNIKDVIVSNVTLSSQNDSQNSQKDEKIDFVKEENSQKALKLLTNGDVKQEIKSQLQASRVTAVQTDVLSPNSEQELSSFPYPKSDIIVEGHGDQKITQTQTNLSPSLNGFPISTNNNPRTNNETLNKVSETSNGTETSLKLDQTNEVVPNTEIEALDTNLKLKHEQKPSTESFAPIGFNSAFEDTELSPADMDNYLSDLPNHSDGTESAKPAQSLSSELMQAQNLALAHNETNKPEQIPNDVGQTYDNMSPQKNQSPMITSPQMHQSPMTLSPQKDQSPMNFYTGIENCAKAAPEPMSLDAELRAAPSLETELRAAPSLSAELQQATGHTPDVLIKQSPCRDTGNNAASVKTNILSHDGEFSSMEGAVGHSPECDSLEPPNYKQELNSGITEFPRKGVVSDINISLSQDGDCLEIEQIINEPISLSDYDESCLPVSQSCLPITQTGTSSGVSAVPHDITGIAIESIDSDYCSGQFTDSVSPRNPEQSTIGQGARPKEPTLMKKGRPNSLLGLSKVNLDSPYAGSHVVDDSIKGDNSIDSSVNSAQHQAMLDSNIPQMDSFQRETTSANLVNDELIVADDNGFNDPPVLRRNNDTCSATQNGIMGNMSPGQPGLRPHSWSPGGTASPQYTKSKRPSSLNLPPLGEFNPNEPGNSGIVPCRTRGMLTPYPDQIQEETDPNNILDQVPPTEETEDGEQEGAMGEENPDSLPTMSVEPTTISSIVQGNLGKVAPQWLPDAATGSCMQCQAKFTFTKRRHHCRACGKIFCSLCCSMKGRLGYMESREARVCLSCHQILLAADNSGTLVSPHPNNPSDYCSMVPPSQQANPPNSTPTVLVPSGVLKRDGTGRRSQEPKQVMFSDGIRPGGDLTELDGSTETSLPFRRTGRIQKKVEKPGSQSSPKTRRLKSTTNNQRNLIPETGLPPLYIAGDGVTEGGYEESCDPSTYMFKIKDETSDPVIFAVNKNLLVLVKILDLECCVKRNVWSFTSRGMCTVGQNEIIILLEEEEDELSPPRDIFTHFSNIYEEASKGNVIMDLGYSIFNHNFLGSRDHGGFLYISPTFQCLQKLLLPEPPYLVGILLQKWETPWAKVFPLRLLLRLGAEFRYYPCPLVSIRNRKPVFFEIGHTIMNLLADFRNYQYMLPQNKGVYIHMEDKKTIISFPRNRYDDLMKIVNNSNEHVMALGASFSTEADSHLVCIQSDEGNYQTQAINIQSKIRKVTGASFVVFNGALKASSGLTAKSSIVEDGLMVQITLESMNALKEAIKNMLDFTINCGSIAAPHPEEIVCLQWVEEDRIVNMGVKSPIDGLSMDTIESVRVHKATDYVGESRSIRWTEVFFIQNEDVSSRWEPVDLSRLGEMLASAFCIAMTPHLDRLKEASLSKLGLRVTLDSESVGYEIGANNEKLPDFYMNDLDSALIPVIHAAASQNQEGPIIMELIFYVLE